MRLAQRHSLLTEQIYLVLLNDFNVSGGQSVLKWSDAMLKKVRCGWQVQIKDSPSALQSSGCVRRILDMTLPMHTLACTHHSTSSSSTISRISLGGNGAAKLSSIPQTPH